MGAALLLALGACSGTTADSGEKAHYTAQATHRADEPPGLAAAQHTVAVTIPPAVTLPRNAGHHAGDTWFLDASSVESTRRVLAELDLPRRFPARLHLARGLLATGAAEEATETLRELLSDLDAGLEPAPPWFRARVLRELATAWMVVGEQGNCIFHHGTDSCLAPISEAGRHVDPRGSREAMAVLEQMLGERPDDLEARWLLNSRP